MSLSRRGLLGAVIAMPVVAKAAVTAECTEGFVACSSTIYPLAYGDFGSSRLLTQANDLTERSLEDVIIALRRYASAPLRV